MPTEANLVPFLLDAARAEATLGEMCDVMRERWGGWTERATF
jgi:methylmalonyl-CoA mutase N-terminal domain/subunit